MTDFILNSAILDQTYYVLGESVLVNYDYSYTGSTLPPTVTNAAGFIGGASDSQSVFVSNLPWNDNGQFLLSTSSLGSAGEYTLVTSLDFGNTFSETDENNNRIVQTVDVRDAVKLSSTNFGFVTNPNIGESFDFILTLENAYASFGQDISDYQIDLVHSPNDFFSTSDASLATLTLGDFTHDGNGVYTYAGSAVMGDDIPEGNGYIGVVGDWDDAFYEGSNITPVQSISVLPLAINFEAPYYDLGILSMSASKTAAQDGETIQVTIEAFNYGDDLIQKDFDVKFELEVVGIPVEIDTITETSNVVAFNNEILTYDITLSQGATAFAPGDYTLRATLDSGDAVNELDEVNNSGTIDFTILPPGNTGPATGGSSDFDANGADDILFFNDSTNTVGQFQMPTGNWKGVGTAGNGWKAVGTGLFDNDDSSTDILWFNENSGNVGRYDMDGGSNAGWNGITRAGSGWEAVGAGDFNNDGIDDILWFNEATGKVGQHQVSASGASWMGVGSTGSGWEVAGVDDLNADGIDDILWQNKTNGGLGQFQMAADGSKTWVSLGSMGSGFEVVGTGDFWSTAYINSPTSDHNDILVFNDSTGALGHFDLYAQNGSLGVDWIGMGTGGSGWSVQGTGDFDADGVDDILWRKDDGRMGIYDLINAAEFGWVELNPAGTEWDVII